MGQYEGTFDSSSGRFTARSVSSGSGGSSSGGGGGGVVIVFLVGILVMLSTAFKSCGGPNEARTMVEGNPVSNRYVLESDKHFQHWQLTLPRAGAMYGPFIAPSNLTFEIEFACEYEDRVEISSSEGLIPKNSYSRGVREGKGIFGIDDRDTRVFYLRPLVDNLPFQLTLFDGRWAR